MAINISFKDNCHAKNRGTHGVSSFRLTALAVSNEKPCFDEQ